jgi:hypothetical protein
MKKLYKIFTLALFSFLLLHSTLLINNCMCQWQPDVRLTNNPDTSLSTDYNGSRIASNGSIVHTVWFDTRDGNKEIYYKRSTDAGITWGADIRLTNDPGWSFSPCIAISGTNVYVVWVDTRIAGVLGEIFYKNSTDNGITWGADTRLVYRSSGWGSYPSIAESGQNIHVFWHDTRDGGGAEIYYKRSSDAGVSWSSEIRITNAIGSSFFPSCCVSGSTVHLVWCDYRDGNYEIYYKCSIDEGINWDLDRRLTFDSSYSYYPYVAVSGSNAHIVWCDNRDGNYELYYKRSTDEGLNWGSDTRLTNASGISYCPAVCVYGQVVHVLWSDDRDGNFEIYYKQNPTGNPIGIVQINTYIPKEYKLMQNYPNPFNPTTKINYQLPITNYVKLSIYDILGREITVLVNEKQSPGMYEVDWDASNYASGVYFYTMQAGDYSETKKMLIVK